MTAFSEFLRFAHGYGRRGYYSVASNCYLMAARFADDRAGEQLALTFGWWMHERHRGRISHSETNREDDMDTTRPQQRALAQGDGDPGPDDPEPELPPIAEPPHQEGHPHVEPHD